MEQTLVTRLFIIATPLLRNFEKAVMEQLIKYLNRKVRRYRRSHFCHFMLFLLAGRFCEMV